MNYIFDIGNVLLDFKPELYLKNVFDEPSIEDRMLDVVFKSHEWVLLDEGRITHREALDIFCAREPEYTSEIQHTIGQLREMITPMHETIAFLPDIKNAGHRLYYLSNYHKELTEYILDRYDFFDLFDGGVFSCDINVCKPSPQIYRYLLEKYSLTPEECVFFDDMEENAIAAQNEGLEGVTFTDVDCVKRYFE